MRSFLILCLIITPALCINAQFYNYKQIWQRTALLATSWSNCGSVTDPIRLTKLQLSPDTVHLPGEFSVTAEVNLAINISAPIRANLVIKRKTFIGWIEIPCLDNVGSCQYDDLCSLSPYPDVCPTIFQQFGLPCHCPVAQGTYKVDSFLVTVKAKIPHWLESGHYKAEVTFSEEGEPLGCYEIDTKLN